MATSLQQSTSSEELFLPDRQRLHTSPDISSLFSDGVLTRCEHRDSWQEELTPQEKIQIGDVCDKRYAEFAAGRSQARQLIATLTGTAEQLLIGDYRQPLWPESVIGSISHSDAFCAVAVAAIGQHIGLGIDVEPFEPLDDDVADIVLTTTERESIRDLELLPVAVGQLPGQLPGECLTQAMTESQAAKLIFSIKEAIYKCCYPQVKVFIDFKQCEVRLDFESCTYHSVISFEDSSGQTVNMPVFGKWMIEAGHIFASAQNLFSSTRN